MSDLNRRNTHTEKQLKLTIVSLSFDIQLYLYAK